MYSNNNNQLVFSFSSISHLGGWVLQQLRLKGTFTLAGGLTTPTSSFIDSLLATIVSGAYPLSVG